MNKYIEYIKEKIKNKKRFQHSLSTAIFMVKFSNYFNIDKKKAFICGILHDVAKDLSNDQIIKYANSFFNRNLVKIKYFNEKIKNPVLLHGVAGAEIVYNDLNIKDIEILSAICEHTTGGTNICKLSKYIFIADFCEPKRDFIEAKKIRKYLTKQKNFDKAYFFSYYYLILYLIKNKLEICVESIDGYNEARNLYLNNNGE